MVRRPVTAFPPDRFGVMPAKTFGIPGSWTGRRHDTDAPSVFLPENMLREARRQRLLAPSLVPLVCVLDPDGDLVAHAMQHRAASPMRDWACYHSEMLVCGVGGMRLGVIGKVVGSPYAVMVAELLFASGCRLLINLSSASQIAMRVLAGAMWFQGTIWKLPLPVSAGFTYWLTQEGKYSAIPLHATLVRDVLVPNVGLLQEPVYLLEIAFTVSLTLGIVVRLSDVIAVLFTIQLWIGLYNDPTEWPWIYAAIIFTHGMFAASEAGRCLGLDSYLRRHDVAVLRRDGPLAVAYRLSS